MSSDLTFITNESGKTLKDRLGLLLANATENFDCLVGYFFLSGFHRLYPHLENVQKIRILVGLQTDHVTYNLIHTANEQQELALQSHAVIAYQVQSNGSRSTDPGDEAACLQLQDWINNLACLLDDHSPDELVPDAIDHSAPNLIPGLGDD